MSNKAYDLPENPAGQAPTTLLKREEDEFLDFRGVGSDTSWILALHGKSPENAKEAIRRTMLGWRSGRRVFSC